MNRLHPLALAIIAGLTGLGCSQRPPGDSAGGGRTSRPEPLEVMDDVFVRMSSPPQDARPFDGHWYKAIRSKLSWHDARKACEELGGRLACVESDAEQEFIATLAAGEFYYLGATDEKQEGAWRWLTGAPVTARHWFPDQPNNYGGSEHYLATYDEGRWIDVAAAGSEFWMPIGFICEWDE